MTPNDFYALVSRMRDQQRIFFNTRSGRALAASKVLERLVDKALDEWHEKKSKPTHVEGDLFNTTTPSSPTLLDASPIKPSVAPVYPDNQ